MCTEIQRSNKKGAFFPGNISFHFTRMPHPTYLTLIIPLTCMTAKIFQT